MLACLARGVASPLGRRALPLPARLSSAACGAPAACGPSCTRRRDFSAEAASDGGARRREAVFMAGMPGSGKTRIIESRFGLMRTSYPESSEASTVILNLDHEIKAHPRYDPQRRASVYGVEGAYEWADERVEQRFIASVADESIGRIVLDGTGGNTDAKVARRAQRMDAARASGMRVTLLYVRVSLATAMRRNARRERVVPKATLEVYERWLESAVVTLAPHADRVEVIDNDEESPKSSL